MTYIEAQNIAFKLQESSEKNNDLIWKGFDFLDASYHKSLEINKWEDCEMPTFSKGYWEKGIPQSSHAKEDGSWCTWRCRQPREENFIYCITEIRQPIDSTPNSKWETVITAGKKPLILTNEALEFFNNHKKILK